MKLNHSTSTYALFALLMLSMGYASTSLNTGSMFLVAVVTFLTCASSAVHLLGARSAAIFILASLVVGWFAEFMGDRYGWFFGDYDYTDALGFKVAGVPLVIPIMWFNLCYICLVLSFLLLDRLPFRKLTRLPQLVGVALLGAVLVTAYDLAADPFMVHVVKAWTMSKKDGWWFGITLQGFVGWMTVAFAILFIFLLATRRAAWALPADFRQRDAMVPVAIYIAWIAFWVMYGDPVETRIISAFAMGTPVLILLLSMRHWNGFPARAD